ncbi:hypothetical protein ACFO1B_44810 [Dactylosporangium siamense]|uniref:Cell division protein FtsL n=1 Tax=Dactylosporangium siamense TaxID=685454 RepID=A0A919UI30_9ACTN|nr:hypothetical protein [Dactylosporangium siamense]GIG51283.1 hypothetical protein Dsi01nite_093240 [Dactylosporangium siamense]
MNVTTLPADRPRRTQQGASRSGGRTTARQAEQDSDAPTIGATALQPERGTTQPAVKAAQPGREARDEKRPRLRVAPPAPVSAPRAPFVALVLVLVLLGVIGILVLNTRIAENAFKLDALRTKQSTLDRDEERLRSDLASKESPVTLASRAKQLGLVPSRTPAFLLLPDGTKLEMPGPSK